MLKYSHVYLNENNINNFSFIPNVFLVLKIKLNCINFLLFSIWRINAAKPVESGKHNCMNFHIIRMYDLRQIFLKGLYGLLSLSTYDTGMLWLERQYYYTGTKRMARDVCFILFCLSWLVVIYHVWEAVHEYVPGHPDFIREGKAFIRWAMLEYFGCKSIIALSIFFYMTHLFYIAHYTLYKFIPYYSAESSDVNTMAKLLRKHHFTFLDCIFNRYTIAQCERFTKKLSKILKFKQDFYLKNHDVRNILMGYKLSEAVFSAIVVILTPIGIVMMLELFITYITTMDVAFWSKDSLKTIVIIC